MGLETRPTYIWLANIGSILRVDCVFYFINITLQLFSCMKNSLMMCMARVSDVRRPMGEGNAHYSRGMVQFESRYIYIMVG